MTSPTTLGPEQQHLEGRSVRDIVEYSPEQVNEVWCRRIFRQILQSLELQYAMHMPHRAITPDTIVFHDNGEPLLTPLDIGPPDDREAEDLTALARVVHYAITQELVPAGPLHGRVDGYSDALLAAVDRCMDPDPAHRPQTIAALRELLGMVPPGPPVRAATPHMMPGLPADDDLAPPAADALAPPHPDRISPDMALGTADAVPAWAPNAAESAAAGTPDTPAAAPRDDIDPASGPVQARDDLPPPGHGTVPGRIHDANLDDVRNGAHAAVPLGKPDAGHGGGRNAVHDTSARTATGASTGAPRRDEQDRHDPAPIVTPAAHAAPPSAAPAASTSPASAGATAVPPSASAGPAPAGAAPPSASAGLAPGGAAAVPPAAPAAPVTAKTASAPAPRRGTGLSRRQRWALGAGGAVLVALVLATLAEMRDSGPIEHIDLATPQPVDGTHAAQPLPADTSTPVAGTPAGVPTHVPAGEGAAAGLGPGETLIPGSAAPGQPAAAQAQPLPGVVVTPNGNVYRLQIQPWGVVYVDGVDRGVSPPVKRLTLTPGRHTIRITNPNFHERVLDVDTATGNGQIVVDFTEEAR